MSSSICHIVPERQPKTLINLTCRFFINVGLSKFWKSLCIKCYRVAILAKLYGCQQWNKPWPDDSTIDRMISINKSGDGFDTDKSWTISKRDSTTSMAIIMEKMFSINLFMLKANTSFSICLSPWNNINKGIFKIRCLELSSLVRIINCCCHKSIKL